MRQASSSIGGKRPRLALLAALAALVVLCSVRTGLAGQDGPSSLTALARVDAPGSIADIDLPVHSDLLDGQGVYYALVLASPERLSASGLAHVVLDLAPAGTRYLLGVKRDPAAVREVPDTIPVLYDDGRRIVVRDAPGRTAALTRLGFFPRLLSQAPIDFARPEPRAGLARTVLAKNAQVEAMLGKVTQEAFSRVISSLSGETAVTVEGESYTIATRHTSSGAPIAKATAYVHERLTALGLTASYHEWTSGSYSGRNVIGEIAGTSKPAEIVLMAAHLDSINDKTDNPADPAPGADDDASGCAALLVAAAGMKDVRFERTVRFVFTTGEENGILGSAAYAKKLKDEGQNVVGVVNLDMIAYSTQATPTQNLHTRVASNPGYQSDLAIANLFISVVNTYGLSGNLSPVILSESNDQGDQYSFWEKDYPAIMAIEDDNNFNPNYHCKLNMDALQYLNVGYGAANAKASLGTAAHLALPLAAAPSMNGALMLLVEPD